MLTVFLSGLFFSSVSLAATSEVTWTEPDKYRDVHPGNGHKKQFRERTFKNFDKHFAKLAAKLPEGQVLKIDVTDVDLAGDVNHGGVNRIRVIKDIFFPRMKFSFQLVNADGSVEVSGDAELKDMSFLRGTHQKRNTDSLAYEKNMIDKWFNKTFDDLIMKTQ